jgi:purine-binding chemotaxis protein CheW
MNSLQFATFTVDGVLFGVEVKSVQEVLLYQPMTRVPLAPAIVSGLINLRGQIVTAVDLRQRMGLRPRPAGVLPMNVVLRGDDGAVSLLVDDIGDVLTVSPEQAEPLPETLQHLGCELIKGVYKLGGRLLLILDGASAITFQSGRRRASDDSRRNATPAPSTLQ